MPRYRLPPPVLHAAHRVKATEPTARRAYDVIDTARLARDTSVRVAYHTSDERHWVRAAGTPEVDRERPDHRYWRRKDIEQT